MFIKEEPGTWADKLHFQINKVSSTTYPGFNTITILLIIINLTELCSRI